MYVSVPDSTANIIRYGKLVMFSFDWSSLYNLSLNTTVVDGYLSPGNIISKF